MEAIPIHRNFLIRTRTLKVILLYLYSADDDKSFGGNLDRLNTRAILKYDGSTKWMAPIILKSKCDIDVKYFPFDTQTCPLKFGSWTYDKGRLNLVNEDSKADTGKDYFF